MCSHTVATIYFPARNTGPHLRGGDGQMDRCQTERTTFGPKLPSVLFSASLLCVVAVARSFYQENFQEY